MSFFLHQEWHPSDAEFDELNTQIKREPAQEVKKIQEIGRESIGMFGRRNGRPNT